MNHSDTRHTDAKVLGTRLEEGVLLGFGTLADAVRGGGRLLARSFGGLGLVIETRHVSDLRNDMRANAVVMRSEL